MTIVSLIAECFWSSSPPSSRWYPAGSRPSVLMVWVIWSSSQFGVW